MSEKFYSLVTKIGQAQFANALALDQKVAFGTFAVGDGGGSIYEPSEDQTELKHEVWSGKITSLTIGENNPNELVVETYIPSNKGGFTIREFGIKDSDGNLLVVGKHPETYKPIAADGTAKDITLRVILAISNAEEVILKIDPSVQVATRQDLEKVKADFDAAKGSLASRKDFEDFKTSFEEEKKDLASKKTLDKHIGDTSLHTTKEDKAKLKAIPTNPKYTDTTYIFDKGLSLAGGKVSAKLGDGLDFDSDGKIKASDEIARKSYVDESLEKSAGSMTESLKGYVKKDGDKVLSSNDFTNEYKGKLDSINNENTDTGKIMKLALMTYHSDKLWDSNNLYDSLNGYYGLNLSSSIRTYDDFIKSESAVTSAFNNEKVVNEILNNDVVCSKMFESEFARKIVLNKESLYKELLNGSMPRSIMVTDRYWIRDIYKTARNVELLGEKDEYVLDFVTKCPYVYALSVYSSGHSVYGKFYFIGADVWTTIDSIISTPSLNAKILTQREMAEGKERVIKDYAGRWEHFIKEGKPDERIGISRINPKVHVAKNSIVTSMEYHLNSNDGLGHMAVLDIKMLEKDLGEVI